MGKIKLHWQILIALFLATIAGSITGTDMSIFGMKFYDAYVFIGTLFLNALKMLIVPLIVSAIITGMISVGSSADFGKLGGKTLLYYISTSLLAILIGLILTNITNPGIIEGQPAKDLLGLQEDTSSFSEKVEGKGISDVVEIILRMVPPNVISAAAEGQMLGLIFFSLLFGYFLSTLKGPQGDTQRNFWHGVFDIMMKITDLVMKFSPLGVFGLVAKTIASTGFAAITPLATFFFTVLAGLIIHMFIVLSTLLVLIGRVNPMDLLKAMAPALLTAFSTSSSSATLPLTIDCVEKNAGVSNKTSSFVLPLGATVNMDGTALYECVAALFIAQAYGLELSFGIQFIIVVTALLTSIGVAGIPSASLVAIAVILGAIGLPAEGIGLILAVDRVLDMCRTTVNVYSDACGAVIMAKLQGERGILEKMAKRGEIS